MSLDYVEAVRRESARFATALESADPNAAVPCCPEWLADDLVWHLTEVQDFWGAVVQELAQDPEAIPRAERPPAGPLLPVFRHASERLVRMLAERNPEDACWSWAGDHTVGWVRRRQAHEVLIHRVDAEQTAGRALSPIDAELASDGVDEILQVMIAGIPEWGHFAEDGTSMRLETTDTGDSWDLTFGRFTGTSPNTGTTYDTDALLVASAPAPNAVVRGPAAALDLWLWGRGPLEVLDVEGDLSHSERLRRMAAEDTQ